MKNENKVILVVLICMGIIILCTCTKKKSTEIVPLTGFSLNEKSIVLGVGETSQLNPVFEPDNATNKQIIWSSYDDEIASVSASGIVVAYGAGTTLIWAITSEGAFADSCEVIVFDNVFTVGSIDDWEESCEAIKTGGNGTSYCINIVNDFEMQCEPPPHSPTFGEVLGISIEISGNYTITGTEIYDPYGGQSQDVTIYINREQNVIISDLSLNAINIIAEGENAIITLQGNCLLIGGEAASNLGAAVSARASGRVFMKDNVTLNKIIAVASTNGVFEMQSGTITGNERGAGWYSGVCAVNVGSGGTFIMAGGSIYGNSLHAGGGSIIAVSNGNFLMYDGIIYGNSCFYQCHLIRFANSGRFTMFGGTIYGNEASGVPSHLANNSVDGAAVLFKSGITNIIQYGDGTDILPHIDGFEDYTNYTIIGKK